MTMHWFPKAISEPPPAPHAPHAAIQLTAEERAAIATAVVYLKDYDDFPGIAHDRATLRNLLERLHT
jgi:hypothetical protein